MLVEGLAQFSLAQRLGFAICDDRPVPVSWESLWLRPQWKCAWLSCAIWHMGEGCFRRKGSFFQNFERRWQWQKLVLLCVCLGECPEGGTGMCLRRREVGTQPPVQFAEFLEFPNVQVILLTPELDRLSEQSFPFEDPFLSSLKCLL